MSIKISVVIPVYNSEDYLRDCLNSILKQNFCNYEVICVDDGSSYESIKILEEYSRQDQHIRVIHQKNAGAANARNNGVRLARGEYIWFVDSDDMIKDNALTTIYETMSTRGLDLLAFNSDVIAADEKVDLKSVNAFRKCYQRKKTYQSFSGDGKNMFVQMVNNGDFSISACMFCLRREFLIEEQLFFIDGILNEDRIHMPLCFLKAKNAGCLDSSMYIYRIRNDSASKALYSYKRLNSLIMIYGMMVEQIEKHRDDYKVCEALCIILKDLYREIRKVDATLNDDEKMKASMMPELSFLYQGLGIGSYKNQIVDDNLYEYGLKKRIEEASALYLYGAGEWGKRCYNYLVSKNLGNRVAGFIVSQKSADENTYMNVSVYSIDEVSKTVIDEGALVFLTTDNKAQLELLRTCEEYGIRNIVKLDWLIKSFVIHSEM